MKKHFKNEQRSRDAAAKKRANIYKWSRECTEVWMTILESGWNLWVWLVGVVSRRWVWLVVRRYIDILTIIILIFPTPLVLALFLAAASLLLCSFLKCFFVL